MGRSSKTAVWVISITVFLLAAVALDRRLGQRNIATDADGTSAPAQVRRAGDGSCLIGYKATHCYALTLQVHPPGGAPFVTTLDVNVENRWASRVQPNQWVSVVLLREAPHDVALNLEAFALPPPNPPASAAATAP